ncbi:MAG: acyl-phosphate glycerol 3-phosphate acyltransferase [Coxiella sp. RIFCSPHIGHO2_12_FULL_44_14]|nr:MAG: acyl-phosphate glycerol 3-phosphate acyltransferase [Coxiella sp. RIFCSPHIGHO2_12_FULL_44_14]
MGFVISAIIAYLLGSVSCAILVAKYCKLPDPRDHGSGNPGTTNVWRMSGRQAGLYVLLGDGLKGTLAVLVAHWIGVHGIALGLIALIVVIGHIFPVYFKWKGGKGVATAAGAILGLSFWVGLLLIATWIIVAAIFRYASLASLTLSVAAPIYLLIAHDTRYVFPVFLITILIIWKHWDNIEKLRKGTESKINF